MTESNIATMPARPASLVERFAQRFAVEPEKLLTTLKATCFRVDRDKPQVSNEQMMALLIVAEQYNLNPFTKELFAFDDKKGGIIPYVSVDGWSRIINEQPQFDGMEFSWDEDEASMSCVIYRKDRNHPTLVTEYLEECRRNTGPWTQAPRRMLRHKAMMQCARIAFGFAGLHDQDEAERIRDNVLVERVDKPSTQRKHLKQVLQTSAEHLVGHISDDSAAQRIVDEALEQEAHERAMQSSLADLTAEMRGATSLDTATEILDRGRSVLVADDFAVLDQVFTEMFNG